MNSVLPSSVEYSPTLLESKDLSDLACRKALTIVSDSFPQVALQDQGLLGSVQSRKKFIALFPDERISRHKKHIISPLEPTTLGLKSALERLWNDEHLSGAKIGAEEYWKMFLDLLERLVVLLVHLYKSLKA